MPRKRAPHQRLRRTSTPIGEWPCVLCARFLFPKPTVCYWCRTELEYEMPKHQSAAAFDRAFSGLVKLRRRLGFPAWKTWAEVDKAMSERGAEEGRTWREFLEGAVKGSANTIRSYTYLINETWGAVPWENAGQIPSTGKDKHTDPVVDGKQPYSPMCKHGLPLRESCAECDNEDVGDGMQMGTDVASLKKRPVKKKRLRRK